MLLYHYRPISSALLEIGNGTLHFATREQLNDPVEGYVRVFWQGDKAAWEGLLRNYVCSLSQAIDMYLLQGDDEMLLHRTLIADLHCFDDVPLGHILKDLGDAFLADKEIQKLAVFYGKNNLKVREEELQLILHYIHNKAFTQCIRKNINYRTIPEKTADGLLSAFDSNTVSFPFDLMEAQLSDEERRYKFAKTAKEIIGDMKELQYVKLGFADDTFLYGKHIDEKEQIAKKDGITEAHRRRNWVTIAVDFPRVYVDQLKDMIYPESYVVCFSGKNNDSAMWGNYADHHKGVCLIYETDENNCMTFRKENHECSLAAKPISYEGDLTECNFFETFGRFTRDQIRTWLSGVDGISSAYDKFSDEEEWRNRYWEAYDTKTYRKIKAWEHENEYRLALTNTFCEFNEPTSRNLRYEPKAFKGVIFGIKTSEYDKKRIMEKLLEHEDELTDFSIYQAEYDDEVKSIAIRRKTLWALKR